MTKLVTVVFCVLLAASSVAACNTDNPRPATCQKKLTEMKEGDPTSKMLADAQVFCNTSCSEDKNNESCAAAKELKGMLDAALKAEMGL